MYYSGVQNYFSRVRLIPKHNLPIFCNLSEFGDMNEVTHECKVHIFLNLDGVPGHLSGEFIKGTNQPDGRCVFRNLDKKQIFLLYFKNGELADGPKLHCVLASNTAEIYSNTWSAEGK
jgi:hypothetical protein